MYFISPNKFYVFSDTVCLVDRVKIALYFGFRMKINVIHSPQELLEHLFKFYTYYNYIHNRMNTTVAQSFKIPTYIS